MSDMLVTSTSNGNSALATSNSSLLRVAPEPTSSWTNALAGAASVGVSVAASVIPGADVFAMGDLQRLLQMQIEIQRVMQIYTAESNIQRSKHETEMAPVRNMRVG